MKQLKATAFVAIGTLMAAFDRITEIIGAARVQEQNMPKLQRLDSLKNALHAVDMTHTLAILEKILKQIKPTTSGHEARGLIKGLEASLETELGQRFFGYVSPAKAEWWKRERLFGEKVYETFPNTRADISAAGTCYAVDQYTACVFHLMRVMEIGVRYFGKKLGVKLIQTAPGTKVRELTWHQILDQINPKLAITPKTAVQKRKHEKRSAVKSHLEAVKDAWRNPTMHPHSSYDEIQAMNILIHVRSFMIDLAQMK